MAAAPCALASDDSVERDAQARFEEGLQRVKAGDFDAARLSFVEAYAVLHRPRILWNLALSEEKTGHPLDALAHFKQVAGDDQADPSDRTDAQAHISTLEDRTGHLDVRAPEGASIEVDGGNLTEMAPLSGPVDVLPGRHIIAARLGRSAGSLAVDVGPGVPVGVDLSAIDERAPSPVPKPAPMAPSPPVAPVPAMTTEEPSMPVGHTGLGAARIATVTTLGVLAVGAVVVGAVFGSKSQSDADT